MTGGLAVMVDLGWPWWVTTVIAVGVVGAAAVVYVVRREPGVRAVAAVLALEGVVIALVAPFVMEDGASSATAMRTARFDSSAMVVETSLSHSAFVRRADENCTKLNKQVSTLGDSPSPKDLPGMGHYLDRLMPLFNAGLRRQASYARAAPRPEHSTTLAWMHAMNAMGKALEGARESAKAGDGRGLTAAFAASDAAALRSKALSKRLGLKVCFS